MKLLFFFWGGAFHVLSIIYTDKGSAPEAATSLMGLFCSLAMKPITEKMANPEKKLVPELMAQTSSDCLIKNRTWENVKPRHGAHRARDTINEYHHNLSAASFEFPIDL